MILHFPEITFALTLNRFKISIDIFQLGLTFFCIADTGRSDVCTSEESNKSYVKVIEIYRH